MDTKKLLLQLLVLLSLVSAAATYRPVVLWHGMGDTCCYSFSMGAIKKTIQELLPGTYVYSVEIGDNIVADEIHGFLGNANDQVDFVCNYIRSDPNLKNGFNAIGFSQGGQFLRAYVERCNDPPVYNLITMGGQHQGVADIPKCTSVNTTVCSWVEELLSWGAYVSFVQDSVIQAQYFKDPMDIPTYMSSGIFLPDINNEKQSKNATYKSNLVTLNKLALFQFIYDTVVVPKESEWFGYYKDGSTSVLLTMEETAIYQQDWIGLQVLNKQGKIDLKTVPGDHMQFTIEWFNANVVYPYLNNSIPTTEWIH